jgi:predicted nicotinamide N-methyase
MFFEEPADTAGPQDPSGTVHLICTMFDLEQMEVQEIDMAGRKVKLCVPEPAKVRQWWRKEKDKGHPFPYWSQVWPASIALARYLVQHPGFIAGKEVLEIAAGLGLPSMVAAPVAWKVTCTDYIPEAVEAARKSAEQNGFANMDFRVLDWRHLPPDLRYDVLLLSDVNYDPGQFEVLENMLTDFLYKKVTILLCTPQRLFAKDFVSGLLKWCIQSAETTVNHMGEEVTVTVLVLKA